MAHVPALPVAARSSHGAGDMFCGALGARFAAGDGLLDACAFATRAAGLFVSLPEVERASLTSAMVARA